MLRNWQTGDVDKLTALEKKSFKGKRERKKQTFFADTTEDTSYTGVCIEEENGDISSYGSFKTLRGKAIVKTLATDENYRRQGKAKEVMNSLQDTAKAQGGSIMRVVVRKSDTASQAFYKNLGYKFINELPRYFRNDDGTHENGFAYRKLL